MLTMLSAALAGLAAPEAVAAGATPAVAAPAAAWAGACPSIPAPPADMDTPNKYAPGRGQDRLSATNAAAFETSRVPLNQARDTLNGLTQRLLLAPANGALDQRRALGACLLANLDRMAQAGSLTGKMSSQAQDLRLFLIPTLASGYLAAKSVTADFSSHARIEAWLGDMLAATLRREDLRALVGNSPLHPHMINNHYYWAGLGALLVGLARDDARAYNWGRRAVDLGLDQIDPDGFLPAEAARATRALSYHAFALQPLSMSVFILAVNGQSPSPERLRALARLGDRTMASLADPRAFAAALSARGLGQASGPPPLQADVPKTPPAIPFLMMVTGRTAALAGADARVRCYPAGAVGPSPGVWASRDAARLLRGPNARRGGASAPDDLHPLPAAYKICNGL